MKQIVFLALAITMSGCSTYLVDYKTDVSKHEQPPTKEDSLTFEIRPVSKGIIFTIQNESQENAKIIWDKSYFITPDGNSYKALNTDLLDEDSKVAQKSSHESIIPSNASFTRFTTPTTRAHEIKYTDVSQFYSSWNNSIVGYSLITNEKVIRVSPYWQNSFVAKGKEDLKKQINDLYTHSKENNKLGLGLMVEHAGVEREYRFDIRIDEIHVIKPHEDTKTKETTYTLEYIVDIKTGQCREVGQEIE